MFIRDEDAPICVPILTQSLMPQRTSPERWDSSQPLANFFDYP
jgi:hypothetical protein